MAKRKTVNDRLDEAFDHLQALQELILDIAEVEPAESSLLLEEAEFPESFFVVGECDDEPVRGELAVDTRMHLALTDEQAREVVSDLLNGLRDQVGAEDIRIDLDGRWFMKGKAARDVRRILTEGGE
jgi:hypothetical protein